MFRKRKERMSRVGKKVILCPKEVTVGISKDKIDIQGPLGKLSYAFPPGIKVEKDSDKLIVNPSGSNKTDKAFHGLFRSILNNMVQGVVHGFQKKLEIRGVGYKAQVQGGKLTLNIGFSHPVVYDIPEGIKINVEKQIEMTVKGADKHLVGQVAAEIRGFAPPEPYKGKGIRYTDEVVKTKVGKTGA